MVDIICVNFNGEECRNQLKKFKSPIFACHQCNFFKEPEQPSLENPWITTYTILKSFSEKELVDELLRRGNKRVRLVKE